METMVEILGLGVKIDTILTEGILTKIFEESKIDEAKIVVPKIGVLTTNVLMTKVANVSIVDNANSVYEEGIYSSVDEVEVTFIYDFLT